MYRRTFWQDHVTEFINRFRETENPDGTVCHEPVEGEILQEGTLQNAGNFNNIEMGIMSATEQVAELARMARLTGRVMDNLQGEVGTAILNNTQAYPFNNSVITVSLSQPRQTTDYTVDIVDAFTNNMDSQIGRITVFDKLLNGFKIAFTGGARRVDVRYVVRGGMH